MFYESFSFNFGSCQFILITLTWQGLVNSLCYLLLCIDYLGSEFVLVISNVKRSCVSHKANLFLYQF